MSVIYAVCGYRGHGKDTFFKWLCGSTKYRFRIARLIDSSSEERPRSRLVRRLNYQRFASADVLKQSIADKWGLTLEQLDSLKDTPNPEAGDGSTYRDDMIRDAAVMTSVDPHYYVKHSKLLINSGQPLVITDLRLVPELEYLQEAAGDRLRTIRVHRPGVRIPPSEVMTEHALDHHVPDYLAYSGQLEDVLVEFPALAEHQYVPV